MLKNLVLSAMLAVSLGGAIIAVATPAAAEHTINNSGNGVGQFDDPFRDN
jgi:hypothetical protein